MNPFINDTIVCDTATVNAIINSGNYDYNSEIDSTEKSIFDKVMQDFYNWLEEVFGGIDDLKDAVFSPSSNMRYVWIAIGIVAILIIVYFIYKKKMLIFKKKKKADDDYEVVEDTIYGIDFEQDIARAINLGNYREAIRLRYLQCLKMLSDKEKINWRIYKTPTQYTREFSNVHFLSLTRQYMLVRYGGYSATTQIYDHICSLYNNILSTLAIDNDGNDAVDIGSQQEGGEHED